MEFSRQIENLIKDIQDIERMLGGMSGKTPVPTLEIDILKKRVQQFYEDLLMLSNTAQIEPTADVTGIIPEAHHDSEEIMEDSPASMVPPPPEEETGHRKPVEDEEPVQEPSAEIPTKTDTGETAVHTEIKKKPEVLADRFKDKQQFRNEHLIKGQAVKDLSSKYDEQPLPDIALGIGLNERFQYIKELFQGNATDFKQTIDYLNKVNTEEDAITYFNEHFNWDMEHVLVVRLLHLTRRKLKMNVDG